MNASGEKKKVHTLYTISKEILGLEETETTIVPRQKIK